MIAGVLGMLMVLFIPGILAGVLGTLAIVGAARFYNISIRCCRFDLGVVLGFGMYIYTLSLALMLPLGGHFIGHIGANVVTTAALLLFLPEAFQSTSLTPNSMLLRSRPDMFMSLIGVKGVTVTAALTQCILL